MPESIPGKSESLPTTWQSENPGISRSGVPLEQLCLHRNNPRGWQSEELRSIPGPGGGSPGSGSGLQISRVSGIPTADAWKLIVRGRKVPEGDPHTLILGVELRAVIVIDKILKQGWRKIELKSEK